MWGRAPGRRNLPKTGPFSVRTTWTNTFGRLHRSWHCDGLRSSPAPAACAGDLVGAFILQGLFWRLGAGRNHASVAERMRHRARDRRRRRRERGFQARCDTRHCEQQCCQQRQNKSSKMSQVRAPESLSLMLHEIPSFVIEARIELCCKVTLANRSVSGSSLPALRDIAW